MSSVKRFLRTSGLALFGSLLISSAVGDDQVNPASVVALSYPAAAAISDEQLNERLKGADLVALLTVNHVNSLVNTGLSMPGMLAVQGYEYQTTLKRAWKASDSATVDLRVDLSDCAQRLNKGETYLVVSRFGRNQQLQSFECDDLVHQSQAGARIAQLNQLTRLQVASHP